MPITNNLNLPEPLVEAIRNDGYTKGDADFSTTELISPPRIAQLRRGHGKHITEDAADRIFSLFGQAVHTILERGASDKYLVEKRFFLEHDGARISGQIDLYDIPARKLQDWKITSRWTTADGAKPEWVAQANINRLLMLESGYEVDALEYVAIYRDWSKLAASRERDYPQHQVETIPILIWPVTQTKQYLSERIRLHREAAEALPLCTPDERWEKPTRWALMKKGQKRAVKLYDSKDEMPELTDQQYVEERPGECTRCLHYCPVVAFCSFGRELLQEKFAA